jgi:DNA (cytosine-5)-methyltransferase 1
VATHEWICRNGERAIHNDYDFWRESLLPPVTLGEAISDVNQGFPDHNTDGETSENDRLILNLIQQGQKLCNARHDSTSVKTWEIPGVFGEITDKEREILNVIARNRRHKIYGLIPNGNPLSCEVISIILGCEVTVSELEALVAKRYLKVKDGKWDLRGAMFASGSYKRPLLDEPSPTILTVFDKVRYVAHPTEPRAFTVREVARIQTFPDWFGFAAAGVGTSDAYRLIGNAVPPLLAINIAWGAKATLAALAGNEISTEELDAAA